jgi:DNA-binding NtrC family response regulator
MFANILVLANAASTARRYEQALATDGHHVSCCELGATAGPGPAGEAELDAVFVVLTTADGNLVNMLRRIKRWNSAPPVIVVSENPSVGAVVAAMREGAADYLREPCSDDELRAALRRVQVSCPKVPLDQPPTHRQRPPQFDGMLGQCPAMHEVFALIERIAPTDATVLVTGESGTGKEMAVRALHRLSRRRDCPLLGCDCTALAPTLLESELFGHVKGSFSGAIATKQGLFEAAHQGTLLLDEVSNLSMDTQGKLLRVLETRRIRKVGDTAEREVDIRLVGTTNRDLGELVKVGAFRADLYYRLNVVPVNLPPLRQRPGDIPMLAAVFLEHFSRQLGLELIGFSPEAMRQMDVYSWPGNVRELRNIVERLAVLYGGTRIEFDHLPIEIREARRSVTVNEIPQTWEEFKVLKRHVLEDLERRFLLAALQRCAQNVTHAAESVGMQRPNFQALLRHHRKR